MNDMNKLQKQVYVDNSQKNSIDTYFNPISHYLFITPYLLDNTYISEFTNIRYIESMMNVIGTNIKGIWYETNKPFNLKNIEPNLFIKMCNMMITFYQDNFIERFFINNNLLLL
jgi:hypothetical protein